MTLEDFIDIHKDKDLMTKIYWLAKSVELRERDFAKASEARIYGYANDIAEYYEREAWHMNDRIDWLWENIEKEIKAYERSEGQAHKRVQLRRRRALALGRLRNCRNRPKHK